MGTLLIPESPRWLLKFGRNEEGFEIITKLRGNGDRDHPSVQKEIREIVAVVQMEHGSQSGTLASATPQFSWLAILHEPQK
ncbi:uncharacterized protein N7498_004486 [Penicillium cinerascens]|uniref:Major facilitator superfamily (MFS) profile domain-containing protein n=1 Tax=Penicillium cinerascens TaxID=70096 RepID=A0A9W9MLR5_9EURO|nr:uncharacterized protein N7498_004486 [Penicillium cinerascens]KAJ5203607.1 hypothetical protein N7498_004486 [Penicillium cinerascens]